VAGGFFETGHAYVRTDIPEACYEFRCVAVCEAPTPGAVGRFAFGFQIDRGTGCLNRWLPAMVAERGGAATDGTWADAGVFAQ